eukprot:scaffold8737_cov124-Isochrysis_galbana.AAC.10
MAHGHATATQPPANPSEGQHGEPKSHTCSLNMARAPARNDRRCAQRRTHASHCQSLAHHTTLTGRCFKSVDCWVPLCVELQGRSNIIQYAARQHIKTAVAPRAQLGSCQSLLHIRPPSKTTKQNQSPITSLVLYLALTQKAPSLCLNEWPSA